MNHIYETATGRLVSSTILDVPELKPGHSLKVSENKGTWNTKTLEFDPYPEVKTVSKIDFISLFTDTELEAIIGESRTNNNVAMFVEKLNLMGSVDMLSPNLIAAVNGMEQIGLIGEGRAAEILA